jgi:hypothetical protein
MLDENKIRQIAQEVATATLSTANFSSILSGPAVDSEGHDALRITIVISPQRSQRSMVMPHWTPSFKYASGC